MEREAAAIAPNGTNDRQVYSFPLQTITTFEHNTGALAEGRRTAMDNPYSGQLCPIITAIPHPLRNTTSEQSWNANAPMVT